MLDITKHPNVVETAYQGKKHRIRLIYDPKLRSEDNVDLMSLESFEKLKTKKGCIFSNRCPHAKQKCKSEVPRTLEVESGRKVECFLYSK